MKKAIGGLLVVSMLSMPQLVDLNYIAYLTLRNNNRVMYVQFINDEEREPGPADIDRAMAGMTENSKTIETLLKARTAVLKRIETKMDLLSHARIPLNAGQISRYAAFAAACSENSRELGGLLRDMTGAESLNAAQKEILEENTDYGLVTAQLDRIINAQCMAIENLARTVCEGEAVLEML